jgi:hypothetical protein
MGKNQGNGRASKPLGYRKINVERKKRRSPI